MKQLIIAFLAITTMAFVACNGGNKSSEKKDGTMNEKMAIDSGSTASTEVTDVTVVKASFTNVSVDVTTHINGVLSHYFHVKYALTNDDVTEAKNGATMLLQVISQFDNSLLPADQKAAYNNHIGAIKEHAQAIIASADIDAERMHFGELSTHTYELVKAFGAGKKIYYDHCPMALSNKGADWLSESAEIQNPYFKGTDMNACVKVEQIIE
jgi:Protein of unknown function (DUF3347)